MNVHEVIKSIESITVDDGYITIEWDIPYRWYKFFLYREIPKEEMLRAYSNKTYSTIKVLKNIAN